MPSKVDENTYPSPNSNGHTVGGMDKKYQPTLYDGCNYLSMLDRSYTMLVKEVPGETPKGRQISVVKYRWWLLKLAFLYFSVGARGPFERPSKEEEGNTNE